jgi:hypothetical protein
VTWGLEIRCPRRNGAIVAWHEVPGKAPPQKSRPVGYGVICAGVRLDSSDWGNEISQQHLTKLILFAQGLGVRFAVRIKEFDLIPYVST